jgi:phosphoglycerate dehydrogenase-like enzyme
MPLHLSRITIEGDQMEGNEMPEQTNSQSWRLKMETGDTQKDRTTLVLGSTGKTGRQVAERLKARVIPTRVGSRSGERI